MGFFKTKEEKLIELNKELENLKEKYKNYFNCVMMVDNYVFALKGFEIKDDKINICYQDKDTPKNVYNMRPLWLWGFSTDFHLLRKNWIYFKDGLEKMGLEIKFV